MSATLEVSLRFKNAKGVLFAEHIIRQDRVECASFFPSGEQEGRETCSTEEYLEAVQKVAALKSRAAVPKEGE